MVAGRSGTRSEMNVAWELDEQEISEFYGQLVDYLKTEIFNIYFLDFMNIEEKNLIDEVCQAVARCLGVNPSLKDGWVGKFVLDADGGEVQCEINSTMMHIGDYSLILMNYQDVDSPAGKCYLVDFYGSKYNMRLLRLPDPESGEMIFMLSKTINQKSDFVTKVDIDFVML